MVVRGFSRNSPRYPSIKATVDLHGDESGFEHRGAIAGRHERSVVDVGGGPVTVVAGDRHAATPD